MSALTGNRLTDQRGTNGNMPEVLYIPVKAGVHIFAGALVVLSSGYAAPGSTATGLIAVGRAEEEVDNTNGSNGTLSVHVRQGVFSYDNSSAGDLIGQGQRGTDCYVVDDHTLAATSNSSARSRAGKVIDINPDGSVQVQLAIGL
jgi:hypothetical protein